MVQAEQPGARPGPPEFRRCKAIARGSAGAAAHREYTYRGASGQLDATGSPDRATLFGALIGHMASSSPGNAGPHPAAAGDSTARQPMHLAAPGLWRRMACWLYEGM